jgi:hypothetical protein
VQEWSLTSLLASLHDDIQHRLATARKVLAHPSSKGDASEGVWLELLKNYLPQRYSAASAHVVDSEGAFSDQIDIVIFDRQYSPFIFKYEGQIIVPAESVYAVFEAKQTLNAQVISYAHEKASSVRRLQRTSIPIPHAGGIFPAKQPPPIAAGLLTLESDWNPALGAPLRDALEKAGPEASLQLGCVAAHGSFSALPNGGYVVGEAGKPATAFLFDLIERLQAIATVPMIDIRAYGRWLLK